jgi:transposase-like protein
MRQVREVLRLRIVGGVSTREIARRIGVAASTVRATVKRFQAAGLSWPLPEELTDTALEARLFPEAGTKQGHRRQVEPDWASVHRELKRKHVTLSILWDEYIERIRRATATPASASCTEAGKASSRSRCARPMSAATSCSSITPATPCR